MSKLVNAGLLHRGIRSEVPALRSENEDCRCSSLGASSRIAAVGIIRVDSSALSTISLLEWRTKGMVQRCKTPRQGGGK